MTFRRQLAHAWKIFAADGFFLGSGVAFGAILSLVPLLVLALAIARVFFKTGNAREELLADALRLLGPQVQDGLGRLIEQGDQLSKSSLSFTMLVLLLFAGSRVFRAVQHALNILWDVKPEQDDSPWYVKLLRVVLRQLPAFLLVPLVGGLVMLVLGAQAVLVLASEFLGGRAFLLRLSTLGMGLLAFVVLFALIYKWLPAAKVSLRDAMFGGLATALLESVGTVVAGLYLARISHHGFFGISTTLVTVMLWVLYSCQIFVFGAAMTKARAERDGEKLEAAPSVADKLAPTG